jgi:hypothetical protein
MGIRLTSDEILDKIRRAFAPFHVVAELQDYHRQIGFRVYAENDEVVGTYEGALVEDLRNPANLKQLIMDTRSDIHNKDRQLNPWSFES